MDLSKLAEPFPAEDIEWRIQSSGMSGGDPWARVLAYVTARAIMNRLDEVVGPENWKASYTHLASGVMCHLSIRIERETDMYWVEKSDGAAETAVEAFKGGISSALKRAGAVWGIGRYLYKLESGFAECDKDAKRFPNYGKTKDGIAFSWRAPELPEWALPAAPPDGRYHPKKSPTDGSGAKGGLPLPAKRKGTPLTGAQLKKIHALRRDIGVSEEAYKSILFTDFGCTSSKDLSKKAATELIDRLEKRRKQQMEQEAREIFGDSDAGARMGKLSDSALGFCQGIRNMDQVSVVQREEALKVAGLPKLSELEEIIENSADEKELEGFVIKLEAIVTSLSF